MADGETPEFVSMPRKQGGEYLLPESEAGGALSVHFRSLIETARTDHPDFVPHSLIARFTPSASPAVVELCRAGMWEPAEDGYRILDELSIERYVEIAKREPINRAICESKGHMWSKEWAAVYSMDGVSSICLRCFNVERP